MIRIGFQCVDPNDATSFYRGIGPISEMRGIEFHAIPHGMLQWADLAPFDIIFLQRPHSDSHVGIAQLTKHLGKRLWIDYDDDLLNVDFANNSNLYYADPGTKSRIKKLAELSDYITVSTIQLKESFKTIAEDHKIEIIPNALMSNLVRQTTKRKPLRRNRIINWRGTEHHQEYLIDFQDEILKLQKNNEAFCLQFMNHKPWYLMKELAYDRAQFIPGKSIIDYAFSMYKTAPWMQIVPMTSTNFTAAKSNIVWIESIMYAGAPVVAPFLPEWADKPGCFTYRNKKEFLVTCQKVLDMREEDIEIAVQAARTYIKDNLDISVINKLRIDIIERMAGRETLV